MNSLKRSVSVALSVFALDNLCISVILPIFTLLLLNPNSEILAGAIPLSQRFVYLGVLIAAFPVALIFGALFIGFVADSKGRRTAYLTTLAGVFFGNLVTLYAIYKNGYYLLIVGRVIAGFFAGNMTVCLATLADASPPGKKRANYFGLLGAVSGISFVVGILIGGTLSNHIYNASFSPELVFWIVTFLSLANWFLIYFLFIETKHTSKVLQSPFGMGKIYLYYVVYFFAVIGWFMLIQFLNSDLLVRFHQRKEVMTWMLASTGVLFALGTGVLGRRFIRFCAIHSLILVSLFITVICLAAAGTVNDFSFFLLFYFIAVLGVSIVWISLLSLISSDTTKSIQGQVASANQGILAICMAIAPVCGGLIAAHFTIRGVYYSSSILTAIAFLLYVLLIKKK